MPLPEIERRDPSKDEIPEVAAYFKKKRWHFYWPQNHDGKYIVSLDVAAEEFSGPISAEDYKMIAKSKTVQLIDLRKVGVTDAGLTILADMPNLEILMFQGEDVTDDGLRKLARLPNLEGVFMGSTGVTGSGFDAFVNSKKLKALQLHNMARFTNAGARQLGRIPNLEVLRVELGPLREDGPDRLTTVGVKAMIADRVPPFFKVDESLIDDDLFIALVPKGLLYGPKNTIAVRYGEHSSDWPTSAEVLRNVSLDQTRVTSKGLAALRDCKNVRYMTLRAEPNADAILKEAANFKALETLTLESRDRDCKVAGEGIDAIAALSLRELRLRGCVLSEDAMKAIGKLDKIEELNLWDTKFQSDSMKHFTGLSKLKKLVLFDSSFDDTAAKAMPLLPALEGLELTGIKIGETELNLLLKQPKLKTIELWRTGVDNSVIERARQAHPRVSIKKVD